MIYVCKGYLAIHEVFTKFLITTTFLSFYCVISNQPITVLIIFINFSGEDGLPFLHRYRVIFYPLKFYYRVIYC